MVARAFDLNRTRKTYPLYRKKPDIQVLESSLVETARIQVPSGVNQTIEYTFKNVFTEVPICVASPEILNVNVFITSLNLTSVTFQISDVIKQNETCFIQIQVFKNNSNN